MIDSVEYAARAGIFAKARRRTRHRDQPLSMGSGVVVTQATPKAKYGMSTSLQRTRLAHSPEEIYVAWHDGQVVAMGARWRCGGVVARMRLAENAGGLAACQRCALSSDDAKAAIRAELATLANRLTGGCS